MKKVIKLLIFRLFGSKVFLWLQSIYWSNKLKKGQMCEKEMHALKDFVKEGDVVIDIGANCGQYTSYLSRLVGSSGKVFSIEPAKATLKILENVVHKLRLGNIEIKEVALAEKSRKCGFITPTDGQNIPLLGEAHLQINRELLSGKKETVKCSTLDELVNDSGLEEKITFIKCDVEGAELMVFKGGRKFLSKYHPVILCEIEERHTKRYDYTPEAVFAFLKDIEYNAFVFDSNKLLPVQGVQGAIINYIFIPENFVIPMQYRRCNS